MKKLFLTLASLLSVTLMWAQSDGGSDVTGDGDATYVTARLAMNGTLLGSGDFVFGMDQGRGLNVQAYINGEPMLEEPQPLDRMATSETAFYYYNAIKVQNQTQPTGSLDGEKITFQISLGDKFLSINSVSYGSDNFYAPDSENYPILYNGTTPTTYGVISSPVIFNIVTPQANTGNDTNTINLAVGETIDLANYITTPDDVTTVFVAQDGAMAEVTPEINYCSVDGDHSNYLTLDGTKLTGMFVCENAVVSVSFTNLSGYTVDFNVNVVPVRVTSVEASTENPLPTTLYVGMAQELKADFVNVLPANATDTQLTWTSSNESVATINRNAASGGFYINPIAAGTTTITATSVDNPEASVSWDVTVINPVTAINPVKNVNEVWINTEYDLYDFVTIEPEDATNKVLAWTCRNATIVDGKITFTAAGDYMVEASTTDGFMTPEGATVFTQLYFTAYVPVTSIENSSIEQQMYVGQYYGVDDWAAMVKVLPENASNKSLTWESSNAEVISISENGVNANKAGRATLTATSVSNPDVTFQITVTVYDKLTSVEFTQEEYTLYKGDEIDLTYYVEAKTTTTAITSDSETEASLYNVQYTFSTDGKLDDCISIDEDGNVTGVKSTGLNVVNVYVSAVDGFGNRASSSTPIAITVYVPVTEIQVAEKYQNMVVWVSDEPIILNDLFTILPEDANNQSVRYTISGDEGVLSELQNEFGDDYVIAQEPGNAQITITSVDDGEVQGDIYIEVRAHVKEIAFNVDDVRTTAFTKTSLKDVAYVLPEGAYNQGINWSVADTTNCITLEQTDGEWFVTVERAGSVPLLATSAENEEISAMIMVIAEAPVERIETTEETQVLYVGGYYEDHRDMLNLDELYTIYPTYALYQDVTWESTDYDVIGIWGYSEQENGTYAQAYQAGTAKLIVTSDENETITGTVNVEVLQLPTSIESGEDDWLLGVGTTIDLSEAEYTVGPDDAYDTSIVWSALAVHEDGYILTDESGNYIASDILTVAEKDGVWTCTVNGEGKAVLRIAAKENPKVANHDIWITTTQFPTGLTFEEPTQKVYAGGEVNANFTLTPDDIETDWINVLWEYDTDVFEAYIETVYDGGTGRQLNPTSSYADQCPILYVKEDAEPGTYTITATPDVYSDVEAGTITVTVPAMVESINFTVDSEEGDIYMTKGEVRTLTFTVEPEGAEIDPKRLDIYVESRAFDNDEFGGVTAEPTITATEQSVTLTANIAGEYTFYVRYSMGVGEIDSDQYHLHVGSTMALESGWNWVSTPDATMPDQSEFTSSFGESLVEVRSQDEAAFKDPVYGFFGSLEWMDAITAYKMKADSNIDFVAYNLFGTIFLKNFNAELQKGWNWLAYPYDDDYSLETLLEKNLLMTGESWIDGNDFIMLVAQDGKISTITSAAEYEGTLETLTAGECYMAYLSADYAYLEWPSVRQLGAVEPLRANSRRTDFNNPFLFDIHQFSDVMAMIATVDGLDEAENCLIGAFVEGECRGMGEYVNGKFYIGVHGQKGDVVVFKAYDTKNDLWYDIEESQNFAANVGTTRNPVRLTTQTITNVGNIFGEKTDGAIYDVTGRRVEGPASTGIYIKDGKKALVK